MSEHRHVPTRVQLVKKTWRWDLKTILIVIDGHRVDSHDSPNVRTRSRPNLPYLVGLGPLWKTEETVWEKRKERIKEGREGRRASVTHVRPTVKWNGGWVGFYVWHNSYFYPYRKDDKRQNQTPLQCSQGETRGISSVEGHLCHGLVTGVWCRTCD